MHSILVRHVDGVCAGDVTILALDISLCEDAWNIAKNISASYEQHGIDKGEMVYWFKSGAGLHHIWAEQTSAASQAIDGHAPSLSDRVCSLLFPESGARPLSGRRDHEPLRRAA